jgi:predicted dehydrogenase
MKFIVLGAAGRMGQLHTKHLRELGHDVHPVDPEIDKIDMSIWPSRVFDGVVICTPAEQHAADINTVIAAGLVKHIFVEKPICLIKQLPGMRKMALDAKMAGVSIHVGYNLRFNRAVENAIEMRRGKLMKPVFAATFILRQVPKRPIKSFLEEWASHEVDLALYLFGREGVAVSMPTWKPEGPEFRVMLRHKGGAVSFVHADGYYEPSVRTMTLVDEVGTTYFNDIQYGSPVTDRDYLDEIKAWINEIENHGGTGLATAADGIAAIDIFTRGQ